MAQRDNPDYYKVGGSSGGPGGPLDQFKKQVSRSRSTLGRDEEQVLPGERPVAGVKRGGTRGGKKSSAVGSLPRVIGTAGVSSRAKPPRTRSAEEIEDMRRGQRAMAEAEGDRAVEDGSSPTPSEAARPAQPAYFQPEQHERFTDRLDDTSAIEDEFGAPEMPAWLWPTLRPFVPLMRLVGGVGRLLDPPVRFALDTMQWIGRLAEATPRPT